MQLLYHSESFVVMQFDPPRADGGAGLDAPRAGFEIVDKFARKEIFLQGALAERFRQGVEALAAGSPGNDTIDEFIAGFTQHAQQPLSLH